MNWKNEAVERLRNYPAAVRAMENLASEIQRVEALVASPGSVRLDAPIHGAGKQEDWLLDNLMSLQLLKARLRQTQDWKRVTDRAMGTLAPEEQEVLRQIYWKEDSVEVLSRRRNADRSTLYRQRDKALEKFALALYGPAC